MGIKTIEYFKVSDVYTEDGRGPETVIGNFWDHDVAQAYSKGKGNYSGDAHVQPINVIIADSAEDMDDYHQEEIRQKALKKLTEQERKALGLA